MKTFVDILNENIYFKEINVEKILKDIKKENPDYDNKDVMLYFIDKYLNKEKAKYIRSFKKITGKKSGWGNEKEYNQYMQYIDQALKILKINMNRYDFLGKYY